MAFEGLWKEFADVFSQDSGGLREDAADEDGNPDGRQPTHKSADHMVFALRHVQWVQDEIETLERVGVIAKSVSPWAQPYCNHPEEDFAWRAAP